MIETTINQWAEVLFGIYGGLIAGIIYEILRGIRHVFKNTVITIICDTIFWICAVIVSLYVMMMVNSGVFRLFILIAIILGFVLYMTFISDLVHSIFGSLQKFFKMIYNKSIHK